MIGSQTGGLAYSTVASSCVVTGSVATPGDPDVGGDLGCGDGVVGVQPRYGQKPPSVDHGASFCCSDEVSALVVKAAVEAEHRDAVPI